MAGMASFQATVRGRVQGVCFRAFVEVSAVRLALTGYVRNRPDGTVEVRVEGEKSKLEELLADLKAGPPLSRVEDVVVVWGEYTGGFLSFAIRY